jgi:BarA-like signal transduction histidine kinase
MTCSTDEIADTQRLMQQTLGRCLLRIQQYEKLLKTMLAHSQL